VKKEDRHRQLHWRKENAGTGTSRENRRLDLEGAGLLQTERGKTKTHGIRLIKGLKCRTPKKTGKGQSEEEKEDGRVHEDTLSRRGKERKPTMFKVGVRQIIERNLKKKGNGLKTLREWGTVPEITIQKGKKS